jgi:alpha-mannosidase
VQEREDFSTRSKFNRSKSIVHYKAPKETIIIYNKAGFQITKIQGDNEFQLLKDAIFDDFGINMNFANPQEHVLEAKCNNRVIKERIQATFHQLFYKQITKTMTKILVIEAAKQLNFFPAKQRISQLYSLRMIFHQNILTIQKIASTPLDSTFKLMTSQI